ncbi:mono/diheme cytochrome c family protein [Lewinella aquimaris]|uniref:Mono/diheme cytochrome c family protein n=1 Tax=Neolewinella aquimaris TaxID=1835722 RepID=A0A840E856_9BACT|nr:cytochrome c [Neolewinella aquimaris]MBB4078248.1 mono/diheme cytochrome c family protein [Neolewinella aquimaris]
MINLRILAISLAFAVIVTACSDAEENFPGSEYMPDMAHSVAVEANTYNYYYYNTWNDRSTIPLGELVYPKYTVAGTVPRGYAGSYTPGMLAPTNLDDAESMRGSIVDGDHMNAMSIPTNGHVPYYYEDTPEGREAAIADNLANPFPITDAGMVRGANLYNIFCAICHGEAGNGLGYIYDTDQNPQAKYPAAPASFLRPEFLEASNQRYYHAIMYGYNVMGAYADKMNYEERWQVIHYIRSLQAKETGTEYNEQVNTFDPAVATPMIDFDPMARQVSDDETEPGSPIISDAAPTGGSTQSTLRKK